MSNSTAPAAHRLTITATENGPVAIANGTTLNLDRLSLACAWAAHKATMNGPSSRDRINAAIRTVGHFDLLVCARKLVGPEFATEPIEHRERRLLWHLEARYGREATNAILHNALCQVYALHPEAYKIEQAA